MSFARRTLSLLAAYAVALQLLLLPFAVAAGAALPGAHCAPDVPGQHQGDGCPCCASGCGMLCHQTVLAAPISGAVPAPVRVWTAWRRATEVRQLTRPVDHAPMWARGPPRSERA